MYVFSDLDGWVCNIAVADREIPEITAIGGVYLDDEDFVDVYQNPTLYKIVDSQPVKQDAPKQEVPVPSPEPNQDDYLLDLDFRLSMIELGL